jgi:mannose-6-phosphate isomerase-like protein (cupin superfamily)
MRPDFVIQDWQLDAYDGDQAPVHVHHAGQEAFICIEGDLEVVVDGVRTTVAPGGFVLVPPGTQHTFASSRGGHVIAVMSTEIAELIEGLHAELTDEERAALWDRHRSSLVGS